MKKEETLGARYHEQVKKVLERFPIGADITRTQYMDVLKKLFPRDENALKFAYATDHAIIGKNPESCWCAETDDALIERGEKRGIYRRR